ncbi:MAG: hypothetical protein EBT07_04870, partial [Actinobacteria bacterium]|nr:hypothetical protein [Actinomycetota bacterium]
FLLSFPFLSFSFQMNALSCLRQIHDDNKNTENWLSDRFASASGLAYRADRIIQYAAELQRLKEERIADLKENGPKAYIEGASLNVTLLRDDKEVFHDFSEFHVLVSRTEDDAVRRRFKLREVKEGWSYFLHALPMEYGIQEYGVEITEEESRLLKVRIDEAMAKLLYA